MNILPVISTAICHQITSSTYITPHACAARSAARASATIGISRRRENPAILSTIMDREMESTTNAVTFEYLPSTPRGAKHTYLQLTRGAHYLLPNVTSLHVRSGTTVHA